MSTSDVRSYNMSRIRAKNTKPEIIVRKYLWSHGYRYRLNHPRLPGKPDVVLRKYRTCIFVNGCFWHGHNVHVPFSIYNEQSDCNGKNVLSLKNSECCKIPKSNTEFWVRKIVRNKERDIEVQKKLAEMGWHSIVIWECELKPSIREKTLASLAFTLNHILLDNHNVKRYDVPEEDSYSMVAEDAVEYNAKLK